MSGCSIGLNVVLMTRRGIRPERAEIDAAALALLARHGTQILATARRYAATPEDAEDACQRGLEILLTKAPSTSEDELIPWLKTVVKHEAFALRRQRERHSPVTDDGELRDRPAPAAVTHEQAERLERLRQGAEALRHLKPHEIRALRLKAEGFSYREICDDDGLVVHQGEPASHRGPPRVPPAGVRHPARRRVLALRAAAVGAGRRRGERRGPRAAAPAHADLPELPRGAARVPGAARPRGERRAAAALARRRRRRPLRNLLESLIGATQHKTAAMGERAHTAAELAAGQKVAAVAATAAALAGGGTALDEFANHDRAARAAQLAQEPAGEKQPGAEAPTDPSVPVAVPPLPPAEPPATEPAPTPAPAPEPQPAPPPPDPANEFTPTGSAAPAQPTPTSRPSIGTAGGSGGSTGSGSSGSGSSEFTP